MIEDLRAAGVNTERAPSEALEDFIASRAPPPTTASPRRRGRRDQRRPLSRLADSIGEVLGRVEKSTGPPLMNLRTEVAALRNELVELSRRGQGARLAR